MRVNDVGMQLDYLVPLLHLQHNKSNGDVRIGRGIVYYFLVLVKRPPVWVSFLMD
jgi:hypothetical protein